MEFIGGTAISMAWNVAFSVSVAAFSKFFMIRRATRWTIILLTLLCTVLLATLNHQLYSKSPNQISVPKNKNMLFVFLSVGNNQVRNQILHDNYKLIRRATIQNYSRQCVILAYTKYYKIPDWVHKSQSDPEFPCTVRKMHKMGFVHWLKYLNPILLKRGKIDYMTILLDDVALGPPHGNVDFVEYFDIIRRHNISFGTPAIIGSDHRALHPVQMKPNQVGRYMDMVEIQSCTFRIDAWSCFYELADTEFPSGWGMDVWYYDYCAKRPNLDTMAVIDKYTAVHNPFHLDTTNNKNDPNHKNYWGWQVETWKKIRKVTLSNNWLVIPRTIGEIFETS